MKTSVYKLCIILFYFSLNTSYLFGQTGGQNNDSLLSKLKYYQLAKSPSTLFAHFDKNVYVNNENVWFTAYLLSAEKNNCPTVLSVLLVNDNKKSIILKRRFVMENGLSFGNVLIPDTIPPGNYSFLLYTNVLATDKQIDSFVQPITIKATSASGISASLNLVDSALSPTGEYRRVQIKVANKEKLPLPGAEIFFHLGGNSEALSSNKIKTDKNGEYLLSIPIDKINAGSNILTAEVSYNKEIKTLRMALPVIKNRYSVKFYPEGGNMVHATKSVIGWEAKNSFGMPLEVHGILYKDKVAIDTIHTDRYGMGKFKLIPLVGSKYEVKINGSARDTSYLLPPVLLSGPVINVDNSIANDSLKISIVSKSPGKFFLMIHNYRQSFFYIPIELNGAGKTVLINLKDVPKGLNSVTILDSLQRPLIERIFFAHYDSRIPIKIWIDKPKYTTRQKVSVRLKLISADSVVVKGGVSVACVQSSRIDTKKVNDIESYFYLKHALDDIPLKESYMGQSRADRIYLEEVLLIKGWRRVTWQEMMQTKPADTLNKTEVISAFGGVVTHNGKNVNKSTQILVMADSASSFITTNKNGEFSLGITKMITAQDKKIHLLLNDRSGKGYSIAIKDHFDSINNTLVKEFQPLIYNLTATTSSIGDNDIINGFEHTINLKGVTIKVFKDDQFDKPLKAKDLSNSCGDYVCRYNFLNCAIHPNEADNRPPVIGEEYLIYGGTGAKIVYKGCPLLPPLSMLTVNGIYYSKEFYGSDYSQFSLSAPDYFSTIYWKHLIYINSKNDVEFSFYTSDITGPFRIVLQGITQGDVIYGEKEFEINRP